jgi:hypothetical protein
VAIEDFLCASFCNCRDQKIDWNKTEVPLTNDCSHFIRVYVNQSPFDLNARHVRLFFLAKGAKFQHIKFVQRFMTNDWRLINWVKDIRINQIIKMGKAWNEFLEKRF